MKGGIAQGIMLGVPGNGAARGLAVCNEMSLAGLSLAHTLGRGQRGEVELACCQQVILDSSLCSPSTLCLRFPPAVAEHPLCPAVWARPPSGLGERDDESSSSPAQGWLGKAPCWRGAPGRVSQLQLPSPVSPQAQISHYADSVAFHLAKILESDKHSVVISSAK